MDGKIRYRFRAALRRHVRGFARRHRRAHGHLRTQGGGACRDIRRERQDRQLRRERHRIRGYSLRLLCRIRPHLGRHSRCGRACRPSQAHHQERDVPLCRTLDGRLVHRERAYGEDLFLLPHRICGMGHHRRQCRRRILQPHLQLCPQTRQHLHDHRQRPDGGGAVHPRRIQRASRDRDRGKRFQRYVAGDQGRLLRGVRTRQDRRQRILRVHFARRGRRDGLARRAHHGGSGRVLRHGVDQQPFRRRGRDARRSAREIRRRLRHRRCGGSHRRALRLYRG